MRVSGELHCSVCGTKYPTAGTVMAKVRPQTPRSGPVPSRRITDLAPRQSTSGAPAAPATETPATPAAHAATPAPRTTAPTPAAAVHRRIKPAAVLDLRDPTATTSAAVKLSDPAHQVPATPPRSTAQQRHLAHFSDRFDRAKQVNRSPQVSRFSDQPLLPTAPAPVPGNPPPSVTGPSRPNPATLATPAASVVAPPQPRQLPPHAVTQHQALVDLARRQAIAPPPATAAPTPPAHRPTTTPAYRPHLKLAPQAGRAAAIAAAVVIMAGYVWVQNYPKLSLQAASNRAGLSASLPGYVPSSYNLTRTDTAPGLVTLNFTSPNIAESLKIAQTKTTWDSSSLLDNYVIKHTDDYSTVQGQGLTIYLYGQNQASWINHGIWYSIEGAARLSREQILKIAFSL